MSGLLPHRRKAFRQVTPANFDGFGNKSRSFNGVDDYVDIPDNADIPTGAHTCSCWVKLGRLTANAAGQGPVTKWGGSGRSFALLIVNTPIATPYIYISGNGSTSLNVSSNQGLNVDEWYHIAWTYTPSTSLKVYINGVLKNTLTNGIPPAIYDSPTNLRFGRRDDAFNDQLEGGMADVRIYDTDLSASDISDLYNGTNLTTNLVGHWLKDTDDVLDHSVNSNNGENFGSIFSPDNPSPAIEFGRASRLFDGNDYISLGNSIKFGDNSNDDPFSISAWIRMNNATKFRVLSDWNDFGGVNSTFTFTTTSATKLVFYLKDSSDNATRGREYNFDMSNYEGEWIHVVGTYNGVGGTNADQGIKIYINGVRVDDTSVSVNPYVAMESTTNNVEIASLQIPSTGRDYSDGKIADLRLFDGELSIADIVKLEQGEDFRTNLIGQWLTDNDDVEDKQGTNDGTNFGSTYSYSAPLPANKLIDTYASACGAYSLRELTTAWAGQPVVEVRRTFDGAYSDFTASEITDGTLATWCQGTSAFVRTWYDQSGNGIDVTQTTEANQPRIATAGVVESDNGKPAINFDTTAAGFSNAGNFDYEGGVSWYAVTHTTVNSSQDRIWCDDIIGAQGFVIFYTSGLYFLNDGAGYINHTASGATTNKQLRSYNFDESQGSYVYGFNGSSTAGSFGTWGGSIEKIDTANIGVGQAGAGGHSYQGKMQELIIYPNYQLHNKENIERNINEFYSIY
jgi:hypothetical protein